jgi:hypothetical protein
MAQGVTLSEQLDVSRVPGRMAPVLMGWWYRGWDGRVRVVTGEVLPLHAGAPGTVPVRCTAARTRFSLLLSIRLARFSCFFNSRSRLL